VSYEVEGGRGERLEPYTVMVTEICLPKIKTSVTRASIGRWFKRVGDPVSVGEPLVEIETDNISIEVAASATGVLSEILVRDGKSVKTGTVLGKITEYGGSVQR
jgi:2-oxoglutarate dehydrogenase E2 component (dihydrolipoamide succinyltransferase)